MEKKTEVAGSSVMQSWKRLLAEYPARLLPAAPTGALRRDSAPVRVRPAADSLL